LNLADAPIDGLKKEYLEYLFLLYELETEDGINMGDYPSFEQFLEIREEELSHN
jgi:hypothetical protein